MSSRTLVDSGSFRVCSSCAASVERQDCHKNRYSQYICRKCQTAGIKFTGRQRLRQRSFMGRRRSLLKWTIGAFFLGLMIAALVLPALLSNMASEPSVSRKSNALIDTQGGILLDAENRARLIEGLERRLTPPPPAKP